MDTPTGDRDVWKELGLIAFQRRSELGQTQEGLAKSFKVGLGTIQRLESGHRQTRRSPTWPKLEAGYGWGPGFIENFTKGRVTEPPRTEGNGRFVRTPRPDGDEDVRDIVRKILGQYAPQTTIAQVLEAEDMAVRLARKHQLIAPEIKEIEHSSESSIDP